MNSASETEFGIVIACCDQDLLFAKGCCASIRYFCGDVPICLIIDGNVSVKSLIKTYGVTALYAKDIPNLKLRQQSFGFGLTKMVALWHAPFKRFLFLDSDTILWGNLISDAGDFQDALVDRHIGGHTDDDIDSFYFRIAEFERSFPSIDWRRHQNDYFCSGVFGARRGILPLDDYLMWLKFMRLSPGIIKPGDQTPLNLMLFAHSDSGSINLTTKKIQIVTHGVPRDDLQSLFPFKDGLPSLIGPAIAIHWAGKKPLLGNHAVYPEPMTFFRQTFLRESTGISGNLAGILLKLEDLTHLLLITKNRIFRRLKTLFRMQQFYRKHLP